MGVYHQNDSASGDQTLILLNPMLSFQQRLKDAQEKTACSPTWREIHNLALSHSTWQWRWYLTYWESKLTHLVRMAMLAQAWIVLWPRRRFPKRMSLAWKKEQKQRKCQFSPSSTLTFRIFKSFTIGWMRLDISWAQIPPSAKKSMINCWTARIPGYFLTNWSSNQIG